MHPKRKAREYALQVLFLWDSSNAADTETAENAIKGVAMGESGEGIVDPEAKVEAMDMARGTWLSREVIDKRLEFHAPQWPPKRQPGVDRAILRLAVWELGEGKTPVKVVIDEAIELAKLYSTANSPGFVNGVLDAILKENTALMSGAPVKGGTVTIDLAQ